MKYKLIQKVNPNRRDDPPQWYATPITGESEGADATTRAATENTTTAPIELAAGLVHLSAYAVTRLMKGEPVISKLTFENAGVLADGIDYASLAAYRKAKGLSSGGGEEGGGEEELPFG